MQISILRFMKGRSLNETFQTPQCRSKSYRFRVTVKTVGLLAMCLVCCPGFLSSEATADWYNSYSGAFGSEFIVNYSDDAKSDAVYGFRWRLRDQDDFSPFLDLAYSNSNDDMLFGMKIPATLFDNTRYEYTVLPQFTPRFALMNNDSRKVWGAYLDWQSVSARTTVNAGYENSKSNPGGTEDYLLLGYVEQDLSTYLFGENIVDNQLRLLLGFSDQDSDGSRASGAAFLKIRQTAAGASVGDHQYFGVLSLLTDNYGYRTWPTGRLMSNFRDGTDGEPDQLTVDGLIVLSRFSKVNGGFSAGALKGTFYNSLGNLVPERGFDSPSYVTDPYQLGRIVLYANSAWVNEDNKKNTVGVFLSRFSRMWIVRGAHVGFVRTEVDGTDPTGTLQLGVDGLRFLPHGFPTGMNELTKVLVNLTADQAYLEGEDGYYKIDFKIEYFF